MWVRCALKKASGLPVIASYYIHYYAFVVFLT